MWTDEKAAFELKYWTDLIAQTNGDMREMVRISGQVRTNVYKILNRNNLTRPIVYLNGHKGNWAQHGL